MAYKKRTKSSSSRSRTGYSNRKSTSRRSTRTSTKRSGRTVQTLRIVVEQPQAVSSVAPLSSRPAGKAVF